MNGLSIANNLLANNVQFNLDNNQAALKNTVTRLSSGLRINSAADDPSGLAIATNLQTQVDAFNTASQNVQNANNAAQVADGALATETDILQRIRNLAVEASSSINSSADTANLQAEVSQLLLEVNRISQSVTFNGQPLLDGSHAGFQAYTDASYSITNNAVLANAGGSGSSLGSGVVNGSFSSPAVPANTSVNETGGAVTGWTIGGLAGMDVYNGTGSVHDPATAGTQQALEFEAPSSTATQTITGLTPNANYQLTFDSATNSVGATFNVNVNGNITTISPNLGSFTAQTVSFTADSSGDAVITFQNPTNWSAFTNVSIAAVGGSSSGSSSTGYLVAGVTQVTTTAAGFISSGSVVFDTTNSGAVDGTIELQVVNTGASTVGVEVQFFSSANSGGTAEIVSTAAAANSLVSVDGLNISIGNVSSADAGSTAYIKVAQAVAASSSPSGPFTIQSGSSEGDTVSIGIQATNAQTLRISNINIANTNAPVLAAEDAIGQVDNALQILLNQRAQLGAVIVRLNEDAQNDNIASVNLQASESAIRDLNVGQATTQFTQEQVLVQVGTSVLAQSNFNASSVLGLFR